MSQHEFDVLLQEIQGLRGEVRTLCLHGCARAGMHDDHERRIRDIERAWQRAAGGAAAIGATSGILSGALVWLGKAVLAKGGG